MSIHWSIHPSIQLYVYLLIHLSIHPCIHLSIHVSIYQIMYPLLPLEYWINVLSSWNSMIELRILMDYFLESICEREREREIISKHSIMTFCLLYNTHTHTHLRHNIRMLNFLQYRNLSNSCTGHIFLTLKTYFLQGHKLTSGFITSLYNK